MIYNNYKTNKDKKELINKIEELGIEIVNISGNEVSCKCPHPEHQDTNPSFFFNLETEKFHCFAGCMKGKGIHQLTYKITGVSLSGNKVVENTFRKIEHNQQQALKIIPTIPSLPLALGNVGETYLTSRGVTLDTIKEWNLQYWHEENAIVIPLDDKGYVLRFLAKDAPKKYKYVSGTKISETLFGITKLPKNLTSIILTEGSLDCIHLHQIGFPNSLALLHADITQKQIKLLGGVADYVYLMLDGDKAGRVAAEKIKSILGNRFIRKICNLPDGKDPDDLSKEEVEKILKEAK
jgi:DNA primase